MKRIVISADGTWNIRDQIDQDTGKATSDKCHEDPARNSPTITFRRGSSRVLSRWTWNARSTG